MEAVLQIAGSNFLPWCIFAALWPIFFIASTIQTSQPSHAPTSKSPPTAGEPALIRQALFWICSPVHFYTNKTVPHNTTHVHSVWLSPPLKQIAKVHNNTPLGCSNSKTLGGPACGKERRGKKKKKKDTNISSVQAKSLDFEKSVSPCSCGGRCSTC